MVPDSPVAALGAQAPGVRDLVVDVARSRYERAAEAHQASGTRYAMGFGTQWRDLLDDAHDALKEHGFQTHKLTPGGHKIPVVNDCLVYVWRVPDTPDAVSRFASSPTRKKGFTAPPPPPMLFEPSLVEGDEPVTEAAEETELEQVVRTFGDTMPLVLVLVESTPRLLQSIDWAIAVLDDAGKVQLHGRENIWEPELVGADAASDAESFDSGTPVAPVVELQQQDRSQPDA
jgi:hypothetical protein